MTGAKTDNLNNKQRAFLSVYRKMANVTGAARAVGMDKSRHYEWLRNNPEYQQAFFKADEEALGLIEDVAMKLASGQFEREVVSGGKVVTREKIYSEKMLGLLLQGRMPSKYSANKNLNISGQIEHKFETRDELRNKIVKAVRELRAKGLLPVRKCIHCGAIQEDGWGDEPKKLKAIDVQHDTPTAPKPTAPKPTAPKPTEPKQLEPISRLLQEGVNEKPVLTITNHHMPDCGQPPNLTNRPDARTYYAENDCGEQLLLQLDPKTRTGELRAGDLGWDEPIRVEDGEPVDSDLVLCGSERRWVAACWNLAFGVNPSEQLARTLRGTAE